MGMKQTALSYITTNCVFNKLNDIISSNTCINGYIKEISKQLHETIETNKIKKVWENQRLSAINTEPS